MECVQSGSYIFHFCLTLDKINKNFNLKCKKYWFWKYLEMISSSIKTRNIKNYINNRWFIKCSFTTRTYTQLFSFIHRRDVQTTIRRNGTAVWTTSQENQLFPFIFSSSFSNGQPTGPTPFWREAATSAGETDCGSKDNYSRYGRA